MSLWKRGRQYWTDFTVTAVVTANAWARRICASPPAGSAR